MTSPIRTRPNPVAAPHAVAIRPMLAATMKSALGPAADATHPPPRCAKGRIPKSTVRAAKGEVWAAPRSTLRELVHASSPARADVVLDWNAHAARAIVTVGGQVPPRALIRLAMVHLAIYDAVVRFRDTLVAAGGTP